MTSDDRAKAGRPRATKGGYPAGRKPSEFITRNFAPVAAVLPSAEPHVDERDAKAS